MGTSKISQESTLTGNNVSISWQEAALQSIFCIVKIDGEKKHLLSGCVEAV